MTANERRVRMRLDQRVPEVPSARRRDPCAHPMQAQAQYRVGLGLERTVAWICGLKHVRETIPFPRLINRLGP